MSNNVAAYRKMFRLDQKYLADKIGITPTTLSFKENERSDWTGQNMADILEEFKKYKQEITIEDIFFVQQVNRNETIKQ